MTRLRSVNPHDYSVVGEVEVSTDKEVAAKVAAARAASKEWKDIGLQARIDMLRRFVQIFLSKSEEFATLATREMGMPITQSREDVQDASSFFQWYLDNASAYLAPEVVYDGNGEVHTVYHEPRGVAAVIVPWNYPASNFVWGCGQNLVAGNTVVFKFSEEVPLCGRMIEAMMAEAGMPDGVFNEVYGAGPVGALLAQSDVDLISFTGSTAVGESLYRIAAEGMKKAVMELGGSAPGIVFEDADVSAAVEHIAKARFYNAGQTCDALKRLIVHESQWDRLTEMLRGGLETRANLGDPILPATNMGPLVSKKQLQTLEGQVADAVDHGAFVLTGGKQPALTGAYYQPTILLNVTPDMRVWKDEVFGPVLPIMKFSTEDEAIALANDTDYGLGAFICTKDAARADRVAAALESGMVSVNGISYVRPGNPFGGYKRSGLGREHGRWGFDEATQVKIVARPKV